MELRKIETLDDVADELGCLSGLVRDEYPDMADDADGTIPGELVARLNNLQNAIEKLKG